MKQMILTLLLLINLVMPVSALEIEAPTVPESGAAWMPKDTSSFADALVELLQRGVEQIRPDLAEASRTSLAVVSAVMIAAIFSPVSEKQKVIADLIGTLIIAGSLLSQTNTFISLAADTVMELSTYGKLLLPVMTTAMAAQGGGSSSAALYTGTAVFDMVLSSLISKLLVPLVYFYLALSTANSAMEDNLLMKMRDLMKWAVSWLLKTLLTVYTTYMSVTGVISGTTDAVALKTAKVTISSVVPVVGGILSDASEAVLISAGIMKNAAGVYGILAMFSIFLEPFLRIGAHYIVLKITAAICGLFGTKRMVGLVEDFSSAMGLLLAMTGSSCLLLLISTICFMKGVG